MSSFTESFMANARAKDPDQPEFPHALARLLAAAPDDQVRDGAQAWDLVRSLAARQQNTAVAETMAMALAELGLFARAIEWQRVAMSIATRAERSLFTQTSTSTSGHSARARLIARR